MQGISTHRLSEWQILSYNAPFVPILSELPQRVARFSIVHKELHVGPATRKVVAGRRVPNVLHHIRMRFDSLT